MSSRRICSFCRGSKVGWWFRSASDLTLGMPITLLPTVATLGIAGRTVDESSVAADEDVGFPPEVRNFLAVALPCLLALGAVPGQPRFPPPGDRGPLANVEVAAPAEDLLALLPFRW